MFRSLALATVLAASTVLSTQAAVVFTGTSGELSASATFEIKGTNLVVTLSNTDSTDIKAANELLTGVFFDINGGSSITLKTAGGSAVLGSTSALSSDAALPSPAFSEGTNGVGAEWAFKQTSAVAGLSGSVGNAHYGISSSGLGVFGPSDRFNAAVNLQGPDDPDGAQYGITSAGDNPSTTNGSTSGNALIKNTVIFTLPFSGGSITQIGNVWFKYGTDFSETNVLGSCVGASCTPGGGDPSGGPDPSGVPVPATLALFGAGLVALGFARRRA